MITDYKNLLRPANYEKNTFIMNDEQDYRH